MSTLLSGGGKPPETRGLPGVAGQPSFFLETHDDRQNHTPVIVLADHDAWETVRPEKGERYLLDPDPDPESDRVTACLGCGKALPADQVWQLYRGPLQGRSGF